MNITQVRFQTSVMTVTNLPQFSGTNGFSTVNCQDNAGSGVKLQSGATFTLSNFAKLTSTQNSQAGLLADSGAGLAPCWCGAQAALPARTRERAGPIGHHAARIPSA